VGLLGPYRRPGPSHGVVPILAAVRQSSTMAHRLAHSARAVILDPIKPCQSKRAIEPIIGVLRSALGNWMASVPTRWEAARILHF
jgi:hypothetical protein